LFSAAYPTGGSPPPAPAVVVIDDDFAIVEVVRDVLLDEDIPADSCPYGHQAHACLRTKRPQVAILDIQMAGIDGIELLKQLRADPLTRDIPVIFFTANAHLLRDRLPNYRQLGAELLPKPFHLNDLIDAVRRHLAA
jgi:CheY-like chemotaxis protein